MKSQPDTQLHLKICEFPLNFLEQWAKSQFLRLRLNICEDYLEVDGWSINASWFLSSFDPKDILTNTVNSSAVCVSGCVRPTCLVALTQLWIAQEKGSHVIPLQWALKHWFPKCVPLGDVISVAPKKAFCDEISLGKSGLDTV